jgi:mRNA-degrading endonuclease RelE of RelBE toxin-antitoxin system
MKIDFTGRVLDALEDAPPTVRKAFRKQLRFLAANLHHPSLRAKKYDEARDLWQARVNDDWRFYFKIIGDTYRLEENKETPEITGGLWGNRHPRSFSCRIISEINPSRCASMAA